MKIMDTKLKSRPTMMKMIFPSPSTISSDSEDEGKQTNVGILHTINQLLPDLQMIQASPVAVSWIFCKVALSIYLQLDSSFPTPGW